MNKNYGSSFSDIKDKLKNSEFDRTFTLWSVNEDEELLRLYLKEKLTNLEISKKLRRTLGSIRARLKLHGHPNKNIINFGIQFADYIKEGINPITGEILNEDSAWRHPKILDDLENYIGISKSNKYKTKKFSSVETNKLIDKERPVFYELMIQIKKFIPKISDRDAELIAYHYDPSSEKKSLQDTANKFTMSRESEPKCRSFCRRRSCTFTEVSRLVPSGTCRRSMLGARARWGFMRLSWVSAGLQRFVEVQNIC